jgi:hypothetical protein
VPDGAQPFFKLEKQGHAISGWWHWNHQMTIQPMANQQQEVVLCIGLLMVGAVLEVVKGDLVDLVYCYSQSNRKKCMTQS